MSDTLSYEGLLYWTDYHWRVCSCLCADVSPADTRDAHMVLLMDMLEVEHHATKTAQVLEEFGKVMNEILAPSHPTGHHLHCEITHFCLLHKIDILINNAGRSQRAIAVETELEVDKAIVELNTFSTMSLTRAVLTHMIKRGSGQIAVVSSVAGKLGETNAAMK